MIKLKTTFIVILQILFLLLINEVGYFIVKTFQLPIPGNILGMILLFILLLTGVVKLEWIDKASSLLIKHLAFFFIPIAVGLMNFGPLFLERGISFLIIIVGSIIIGMFVTGAVSQQLIKRRGKKEHGRSRNVV